MMDSEDSSMETLTLTSSSSASASASTTTSAAATSDPLLSPPVPANFHLSPSSSFVDPPSYSDILFTASNSASNGPLRPSASNYLRITVTDPVKEPDTASTSLVGSGTGGYYTYLITSRSTDGNEFRVRRRFRDFVTLADRLAESHRGLFVPVRPDKGVVEGQVMKSSDFIEQRRISLQKYLTRLASHPILGKSDELRIFLQVQGRLPLPTSTDVASRMLDGAARLPRQLTGADVAGPDEVVQPAKGGRDLLRIFKELKQSVTNDWVGTKPAIVEEDKEFLEKKEKMLDLEINLTSSSQQAEMLVKAQQDIGETIGELGLGFIKLTKFESEEALFDSQRIRANDMKKLATAAVKSSRLFRELNAQTVKHLDVLHEHLGTMLSVQTAFSDRSSALLTVQTLMSDLTSLTYRVEKHEAASSRIFGGDRLRLIRIEELRESIKSTEDAKYCAVKEYERIKHLASPLFLILSHNSTQSQPVSLDPSVLLTVRTLMSDLTSLNYRIDKHEAASNRIFGGDRLRLRRIEELRESISTTEDAKFCAVKEYERIKENNRSELERLDRKRRDDFIGMLKGFVTSQVGYYEKIGSVWETVADEMSGYERVRSSE